MRTPAPAGDGSAPAADDAPTIRSKGLPGSGLGRGPGATISVSVAMPHPGHRIDTFELQEAIGAGGMGAVFRAYDTKLHRLVALKILPPEQAADPEVLQRFYHEGQAAAQLDQENIARVYTIGNDQGLHFIAFEYIEGTTIRQRVEQNGPLSIAEAINYTLQIAGALVHAAERGVVHRDIKPSNIIVTPQGRAKVVDMGLARSFERGGDHSLTQSGMTLGTFDYISPEQARDPRDVDVRSDLYSLGCTLFHMLTGRPPFPEGTVLQKLLQHQEDAPPDVRSLNPEVPSDLAAILTKLMAKDRDRRYQTPELLVRDLLTLAGALGLRSISPEGLVWMSASPRPAWERHLVWLLPAATLAVIVGFLLWWGQEIELPPTAALLPEPSPRLVAPRQGGESLVAASSGNSPRGDAKTDTSETKAASEASTPASSPARPGPGVFPVRAGDDLAGMISEAPSGSTILLSDAGPFELRPTATSAGAAVRLSQRDLTIRSAAGVRPVLRLTRDAEAQDGDSLSAVFDLGGGRVVFEGLDFLVDPGELDEPLDIIRAETTTELALRRCVFHRPATRNPAGKVSALHVRARSSDELTSARPAPIVVDSCHFGSGQVAVFAQGPADIALRDCTLGGPQPAFWIDGNEELNRPPASLHLSHLSVLASTGPVFRLAGRDIRIRLDDSVIAPAREGSLTLIAAQEPEQLDWMGRGNLYGKIHTFLQPTGGPMSRPAIDRYEAWADGSSVGPRELDSVATNAFVWADADPELALSQTEPARALRVSPSAHRMAPAAGARRGPWGSLSADTELALAGTDPSSVVPSSGSVSKPAESAKSSTPAGEKSTEPAPMPQPPLARPGDEGELPAMPPMGRPDTDLESTERPPPMNPPPSFEPITEERNAPPPAPSNPPRADNGVIRTAQQWLDALARLGDRGGSLRLAADADLDLTSCELKGSGRWVIQAEPGTARPKLRFQPAAGDSRRTGWLPALFKLRSGTLQLEGVDIELASTRAPASGRWAAFAVWSGAELSLERCTVTLAGDDPRGAIVVVQRKEADADPVGAGSDLSAASVRAADCLLRSGGDFIDVAPGRRLDLELTNSVVSTSGSLVHGHGQAHGQTAEPVKLVLRQVTARNAGGLIQLESAPGEPDLPMADIVARESIFATTPEGSPLLRIDGQNGLEELRDRVRWEGHGVAYHQIGVYRRDQTAQIGTLPVRYDRPSWENAVSPRDDGPVHGDLRFATDWDGSRAPWLFQPGDARLRADSPAAQLGADVDRIPAAPTNAS